MDTQKLEIVFELDELDVIEEWSIICGLMHRHQCLPASVEIYGEQVSTEDVEKYLKKSSKNTFVISSDLFDYNFSIVTAYKHCLLEIKSKKSELPFSWDEWVYAVIDSHDLVQAWISDIEYDYWQNAQDPLEYSSKGKDYSHLPVKSNGLPPPLEQEIIDISNNPGRRLLQIGYIEAIGSTMWLGRRFWSLSEGTEEDIKHSDWIETLPLEKDVLRVQVAPDCFVSSEEQFAKVQNALRKELYPT